MRIIWWVAAGAAVAALVVGCGGSVRPETTAGRPSPPPRPTEDVWVTLDGYADAENVGILVAQDRGYFADVGLSVGAGRPAAPRFPVRYVSSHTADLGVAQQPQLVLAKEKGAPLVAVGSLLSQPTAAMIWLGRSKIHDIADLKGKTIAVPGVPFQEGILQVVLARAGLTVKDVTVKPVEYNLVSALVSGRADAIFGGSWNVEGAILRSRGLKPVITPVRDLGIPAYEELVVIARTDRVSRDPRLIRRFMAAVARGTATAVEDPKAAVQAIEDSGERNTSLSRKATEAEVKATLPLLSRSASMSSARAAHLVDWMQKEGLIQRKPPASELLTDEYLAPRE